MNKEDNKKLKIPFDQSLQEYCRQKKIKLHHYQIISRSLDARGAHKGKKPHYLYLLKKREERSLLKASPLKTSIRPLIIGAGPAGLFAAKTFCDYGLRPIIIERGARSRQRMRHIAEFWRRGVFNSESNVCFGEGGAGLFSDGKLNTRIKSPFTFEVLNSLVQLGAPEWITYDTQPHLGSNKIRVLIEKMTNQLMTLGAEFFFDTCVEELLTTRGECYGVKLKNGRKIESPYTVLATGHSATKIYEMLQAQHVALGTKDFALGVRIEHPRSLIDHSQLGKWSKEPLLKSSRYHMSWYDQVSARGVYNFCMCPGGYVLSSGSEPGGIVTNGMSNSGKNSPWSNAAVVVSVAAGKDYSAQDLLAGLKLQREIEGQAYRAIQKQGGGHQLPALNIHDFCKQTLSTKKLKSSSPSGVMPTGIYEFFPQEIYQHLVKALEVFDQKIYGYGGDQALLHAPETRTSAPLRVLRSGEDYCSPSHRGLYPCGEGAGYAGGIISAAVDGVKVARSIISRLATTT